MPHWHRSATGQAIRSFRFLDSGWFNGAPMSRLAESLPSFVKLLVRDLETSARFYEALGFERFRADPLFLHLRRGERANVYLVAAPAAMPLPEPRGAGVLICFGVPEGGVAELETLALAAGASVQGPTQQPWHTLELVVVDPDGYRLDFVEAKPLHGGAVDEEDDALEAEDVPLDPAVARPKAQA